MKFGMDNCMSTKSKLHSRVCCGAAVVLKMENALLKFVHRVTGTAFALLLMTQRSVVDEKTTGRCTALRDAPDDTVMAVRVSRLLQRDIRDHSAFCKSHFK
jgi:hypothetical protein